MAITRANATTYLTGTFSALFAAASETSYDWPIDQALRLLETAEADLATVEIDEADRLRYFAACDYYAALLAFRRLSDQAVSFATGPHREDGRGMVEAAEKLLEDAEARAKGLGLSVGDTESISPLPVWTEPTVTWDKLSG